MKNILNNCFFKRKKKFKRNWPNNNFHQNEREREILKFLGYSIGRKIATFAPLGRRRYDPQFRRCWIVQKESAWMEHRGVERGFQPPKFTPPATIGTMRAVPFSALPFFIKPWKYYRPTLAIHPGYSCQRLTTAASLVRFSCTLLQRIVLFASFVNHIFFSPVIIIKTIFFARFLRFLPFIFITSGIFSLEVRKTAFSILFRFNISFFLFFFFRPRYFLKFENSVETNMLRLHGFFYIIQGMNDLVGWIMYSFLYIQTLFSVFVSFFLESRNLILSYY